MHGKHICTGSINTNIITVRFSYFILTIQVILYINVYDHNQLIDRLTRKHLTIINMTSKSHFYNSLFT